MATRQQVNQQLSQILIPLVDIPDHLQANQVILDYLDQRVDGISFTDSWIGDKPNFYTKNQIDIISSTKADLVGGLVPASQLPSFVDDVLEFSGLVNFPVTGETGKIYVDTVTNYSYRWSGSTYVQIISGNFILNQFSSAQPSSSFWISGNGSIDGLLSIASTSSPTHSITVGSAGSGLAMYNTVDQTTNYERLRISSNLSANGMFEIAAERAGSSAGRGLEIKTAGTSIRIGGGGATGNSDSTGFAIYPITSNQAGYSHFGLRSGTLNGSSNEQRLMTVLGNVLQTGTSSFRGVYVSPVISSSGSGDNLLLDLGLNTNQNGGISTHSSKFSVSTAGNVNIANTAANGISLYNTLDQVTNLEAGSIFWTGNIFKIGTRRAGSGAARQTQLFADSRVLTLDSSNNTGGKLVFTHGGIDGQSNSKGFVTSYILGATSGNQTWLNAFGTIQQSGTAGYSGLFISPNELSTGSGGKYLINVGTNTNASGSGTHTARFVATSEGKVGISQATPTAQLHIAAGSATAATSQVKLDSGILLTTPEDGSLEHANSHLYFTIGSTRHQLDQQVSVNVPLFIENGNVKLNQASDINDGYLSAGDYSLLIESALWDNTSAPSGANVVKPKLNRPIYAPNGIHFNQNSTLFESLDWGEQRAYMTICGASHQSVAIGSRGLAQRIVSSGWTPSGIGQSVAVGEYALAGVTTGIENTAIGKAAGYTLTSGSRNVIIGSNRAHITTGSDNTFIGRGTASFPATTGNFNIAIGSGILPVDVTADNQLNIGGWIFGKDGNIGINYSASFNSKFHVKQDNPVGNPFIGVFESTKNDGNGILIRNVNSANGAAACLQFRNDVDAIGQFYLGSSANAFAPGVLTLDGSTVPVRIVSRAGDIKFATGGIGSGNDRMIIKADGSVQLNVVPDALSATSSNLVIEDGVIKKKGAGVTSITANATITNVNTFIFANASAGNISITLPDATANPGKEFMLKKTDSSSNSVSYTTAEGTQTITTQFAGNWIVSDGTNWYITGTF